MLRVDLLNRSPRAIRGLSSPHIRLCFLGLYIGIILEVIHYIQR